MQRLKAVPTPVYCRKKTKTQAIHLTHFDSVKCIRFVIGNVFPAGVKLPRHVKATMAHKQKRGIILKVCAGLKFSRLHSERMHEAET